VRRPARLPPLAGGTLPHPSTSDTHNDHDEAPGTAQEPLQVMAQIRVKGAWQDCTVADETNQHLIIGTLMSESISTKLKTIGDRHVGKSLASGPENWLTMARIADDPRTVTCLVKLTAKDYERLCTKPYRDAAEHLLESLSKKPCLILVHEAVLGIERESIPEPSMFLDDDGADAFDPIDERYFRTVSPEVRSKVTELLSRHHLEVTPYHRNFEATQVAVNFIESEGRGLLFRLYVPEGRIYYAELTRLIDMFADWLRRARGESIRRDGYETSSGRVIEFYGDGSVSRSTVHDELAEFSDFIRVLHDNSEAATAILTGFGLDEGAARELVARYSRDVRRVELDAKHTRESRLLTIRQSLEGELSDEFESVPPDVLGRLAEQVVPSFSASSIGAPVPVAIDPAAQIVFNQQVIHSATGIISQSMTGNIQLNPTARELLEFINANAEGRGNDLDSAVHELADSEAPKESRIAAAAALKGFLQRNGARLEEAAFRMFWKWIEAQVGS